MHFALLGPLEVSGTDGPIDLGGPRQRTVLAYLLVRRGEHVRAEELIDGVWGEKPPAAVRQSLHSYISRLRRLVGTDRIEGRAGGYTLIADPDEVDAARFEQVVAEARAAAPSDPATASSLYEQGEGLWRGQALADLRDQPGLRPDVARLDELRLAALEERVGVELRLGRHQELAARLELLVERHPEREGLWHHLMVALYRSGRQTEALAAYHGVRAELAERLGVDPSPELELLQRRILDHDPTLELDGRPLRGYRLLHRVGQGSVGVVHRAMQPQVDRVVAVKIIDEGLADDPGFIRRFETEARRVARLDHPHIAPIHDYWREPGAAYLVSPLFERGSLADALDADDIDSTVLAVVEQVAGAMSFAHRREVVHGNLHAGNVLLDDESNGYVADFGAVLGVTDGARGRARSLLHVAPEVRQGGPPTVAADVYSLGHLISAVARQVGDEGLLAVARRATAADPSERFGTVDDLLRTLEEVGGSDGDHRAVSEGGGVVRNPYKGLRPFDSDDAKDFFGRDGLVEEVVARLAADRRFVVVVGPSGSGKSSLVRAGVVPALAAGAWSGSERWFVAEMTPGTRPFAELNEAVRSIARSPTWRPASGDAHDLGALVDHALPDGDDPVLLVVDQLEELYTLTGGRDRAGFIDAVVAATSGRTGRVRVVATLRADFYDRPLEHPELADLVVDDTVAVRPLSPSELGQAIAAPAAGVGVEVDAALVARLTSDLVSEPGALPLLQFALTEMFESRHGSRLDLACYETVGGLAGALTRRAEDLWGGLSPTARDVAPRLFLRLVTITDAGDARRRARRGELVSVGGDPAVVEQLLDDFGDARLLSFDRDPVTRDPTVEVAHEALLREWKRLRRWIDDARSDLLQHHALTRAAQEWEHADRDPSFLVSGTRLDQLESWQDQTAMPLSPTEGAYLDAAVARRDRLREERVRREERERALERRANRRLRAIVAVLALSGILGGVVTAFAVTQRNDARRQARVATARQLAAASAAALPTDVERSILLALEAVEATRSDGGEVLPEAEQALHRAVHTSRLAARLPGVGGDLSVSPDGTMLVTEGPEDTGIVDVRDLATGDTLHSFVGHDESFGGGAPDINGVAFSPDGTRLATTGDDGTLRLWGDVWNTEDTDRVIRVGSEPGFVLRPTFDRSGALVAAIWRVPGAGGTVRVVDVATGDVVLDRDLPSPGASALSPDGDRLAVADEVLGVRVVPVAGTDGEDLTLPVAERTSVAGMAWSPHGRWLATADDDGVQVWDAATGGAVAAAETEARVVEVAWSPDSTLLAAADFGGGAYVWRIDPPGALLRHAFTDATTAASGVAFTPDGDHLLVGATGPVETTTTWVWDVSPAGGGEVLSLAMADEPPPRAAFTRDRDHVVVLGADDVVTLWDLPAGTASARARPGDAGGTEDPPPPVRCRLCAANDLATSSSGRLVGWAVDHHVSGWDPEQDEELFEVATDDAVASIAWAPDERHVVIGGRRHVRVVDTAGSTRSSWALERPDGIPDVAFDTFVEFSPDGTLVAVGTSVGAQPNASRVELWDWREPERVLVLEPRPNGHVPAFSPDGTWIAVGSWTEPVGIFDVATGELVSELPGDSSFVRVLAAGPDGTLATAGSDGVVRLWDVSTGRMQLALPEHAGEVVALDFSPDGTRLVSSDDGGRIHVWALDLDELVEIAEQRLTRGLTAGECLQFLGSESCPDA